MITGVVSANNAAAAMWRAGSRTFQPSNNGEIGSDVGEGASYLGRGLNRGKPLCYRLVEEEGISILTGLHCKTKLYSTEADSVPTSQCKSNAVSV
jgi:hypothetical protein